MSAEFNKLNLSFEKQQVVSKKFLGKLAKFA